MLFKPCNMLKSHDVDLQSCRCVNGGPSQKSEISCYKQNDETIQGCGWRLGLLHFDFYRYPFANPYVLWL